MNIILQNRRIYFIQLSLSWVVCCVIQLRELARLPHWQVGKQVIPCFYRGVQEPNCVCDLDQDHIHNIPTSNLLFNNKKCSQLKWFHYAHIKDKVGLVVSKMDWFKTIYISLYGTSNLKPLHACKCASKAVQSC